jgi:cytosine/adenosine deaminase-related metal-dependent hydrolase
MLAIRARQVFDGERLLAEGSVVLVDEGRIAGVQPGGTALPGDCNLAEFPGATLLPGLIDAHVHLCADSGAGALDRLPDFSDEEMTAVIENALGVQLAAGVTTVRDLGDRRWAVIEWRDRNGRDSALPTVIGSGPPITSPKGHCWNMGGEAHGLTALRRAVQERADRGVDIVKIMASGGANTPGSDATRPQFTVEEIEAVVTEAHAAGLPVTAHPTPSTPSDARWPQESTPSSTARSSPKPESTSTTPSSTASWRPRSRSVRPWAPCQGRSHRPPCASCCARLGRPTSPDRRSSPGCTMLVCGWWPARTPGSARASPTVCSPSR